MAITLYRKVSNLITDPRKHLNEPLVDDVRGRDDGRVNRMKDLNRREQRRHVGASLRRQLAIGPPIQTRNIRHLLQERKASEKSHEKNCTVIVVKA